MHAANYLLAQWVLTAYLISIVIFTDVFSFLSQKLTLEMTQQYNFQLQYIVCFNFQLLYKVIY